MGNIFIKKKSVVCLTNTKDKPVTLAQITIEKIGDCSICKLKVIDGYQINNLEFDSNVFICKQCYLIKD